MPSALAPPVHISMTAMQQRITKCTSYRKGENRVGLMRHQRTDSKAALVRCPRLFAGLRSLSQSTRLDIVRLARKLAFLPVAGLTLAQYARCRPERSPARKGCLWILPMLCRHRTRRWRRFSNRSVNANHRHALRGKSWAHSTSRRHVLHICSGRLRVRPRFERHAHCSAIQSRYP